MGEAHPQTTVVPRPYPFTNLSSHSQGSLMPGFVQELPRPPNPCIGGGFFLPPISAGKIDGQKKKGAKRKHLIVLLSRRQPSQKKKSTTPLLSFRALILFCLGARRVLRFFIFGCPFHKDILESFVGSEKVYPC